MITAEPWFTSAFVHPFAFAIVQTGDYAFRKLATQSVVPLGAFTLVLLDTFSSVETLFGTYSSLAMPPLVARWTGAVAGRSAVPSVHALWIAECRLTVLSHVTLGTDTDFVLIADTLIGALFVTLRVGSLRRC